MLDHTHVELDPAKQCDVCYMPWEHKVYVEEHGKRYEARYCIAHYTVHWLTNMSDLEDRE